MKKNVFYLLMLICSFSIFASCKDDDKVKPDERGQWASEIAGTYKGDLAVTVDDIPLGTSVQYIYITKESTNNVKLELRNFSISIAGNPIPVGDIAIANIPLNANNGVINLEETATDITHPSLGLLKVKVFGSIANSKADLRITVNAVNLNQNIEVTFKGDKTSSEVDMTDYAADIAAWYARQSLTITGDTVNSKWPSDGIEIGYHSFNTISIKSFPLSFPPNAFYIEADSIGLTKSADGCLIDTLRMSLYQKNQDTAQLILAGSLKNDVLTLNMHITTPSKTADYVYVGNKKLTGAEITKMLINNSNVLVQPEIQVNTSKTKKVAIYVKNETTADQLLMTPEIQISEGASITLNEVAYVLGTPVDFSQTCKFKVTSQSGKNTTTYTVTTEKFANVDFFSDFEVWEMKNSSSTGANEYQKYEEPAAGWATSNEGVKWIKMTAGDLYAKDAPYAVTPTSDAKSGSKAARLETLNTVGKNMFFARVPKVTSGSVFSGVFEVNITNTLKSTKFGYPCFQKPSKFSGSYKFTPGSVYYTCTDPAKADEVKEDASKTDAPALNAVLYEVDSYAFDFLDGTNLLTSSNIVAIASVKDAGLQATYKDFNVSFDFGSKKFDSSKKYKLAIVCSSSKDGDKFSGAPGSVLYVDDLKVTFE